jgi:hypothetical protein
VSSSEKPAPKHRAPGRHKAARAEVNTRLRSALTLSTMAVAATGLVVAGGTSLSGPQASPPSADLASVTSADSGSGPVAESLVASDAEREALVTRSDRRTEADPVKAKALALEAEGTDNALSGTADLSGEDPRTLARALLSEFGFAADQFGCLDSLWTRESNWNVVADNPTSDAYGIPQALPGSKMASAGADWVTNPVTQIRWGLGYIEDRYGSPCGAWGHSQRVGWY